MTSELLSGPLGLILVVIAVIWAVLMLFSPLFWYGTHCRTREISRKMDELIEIQRRQLKLAAAARIGATDPGDGLKISAIRPD